MPGGIGAGAYGGAPWGGSDTGFVTSIEPSPFDLFCFTHCASMLYVLESPITTPTGAAEQLPLEYPTSSGSCDLGLLSGDLSDSGFLTDVASISAVPFSDIPNKWTMEWTVRFERLPADFTDLVNNHVFFGASDALGPVAGVFISQAGIAYTGSVHYDTGTLILDTPVQVLPDSASLIVTGQYTTFRLAVDGDTGAAFLFVTPTADIGAVGQTLVAVLPSIDASSATYPPIDQALMSVKGTTARPSRVAVDQWCLASAAVVPNLPPVANAGIDQAVRACSIVRLDGSASFDPEGAPLVYAWRLLDGPSTSEFVEALDDGNSYPLAVPTGFTDKWHSVELGNAHAVQAIQAGDVLAIGGLAYEVVSTGVDGNGFYALIATESIPDDYTGQSFKLLRQYGLNAADMVRCTFLPDVLGFYRFGLIVNDGQIDSAESIAVLNVVESPLPRGITPDLTFIFSYLSDFWNMVEDRDRLSVFWSSLAQVAATELFTLWQLEFSKSLRDVQRFFIRRWLHYDLVLGEPLPELTKTRIIYSGVESTSFPLAGLAGVAGTGFVLSSTALLSTATVNFVGTDPYTAATFAAELRNRLAEVSTAFTVQVVTLRDSTELVRIDAPFPFSVVSSTCAAFVADSTSEILMGTGGTRLTSRSYRITTSLLGRGIKEDDLLVVDGVAYRIAAVVDDATDTIPQQRVTVKADVPLSTSSDWMISGYATSELLDFYAGLVSFGDDVYFEVVDTVSTAAQTQVFSELVATTVLGACAGAPGAVPFDPVPLGDAFYRSDRAVRLAKVVRRTYVPIDELVIDVPTLVKDIQLSDDATTLRNNLDYFIEVYRGTPCIRFVSGVNGGASVWVDADDPPLRLWAEYTYLNNNPLIEEYFGIPAGLTLDQVSELPGNVDYLSAVRGLWYAYANGPSLRNLRVGSQILLGLPFAEEEGIIEEIRTDFSPTNGRILIRDTARAEIVRSYTFPTTLSVEVNPATGVPYAVGDTVTQFSPLIQGVEVEDWVSEPKWFEGLLNQGLLVEVEKFHRFLVRIDANAFDVAALVVARNFVLQLKPRYTYPLFVVSKQVQVTEVDVADTVHVRASLRLVDSPCQPFSAAIFDDAKATGGDYWNYFDTAQGGALPTFPTSDSTIEWAFDQEQLCPLDSAEVAVCENFAGGVPPSDASFRVGATVYQRVSTLDAGPLSVVAGSTGLVLTITDSGTVVAVGTVARVLVLIAGGPGADPDDYEVALAVNGTVQATQAFTATADYAEVQWAPATAVVATDVLSVRIRHGGGSARSPDWTYVRAWVEVTLTGLTFDDPLPAGVICGKTVVEFTP